MVFGMRLLLVNGGHKVIDQISPVMLSNTFAYQEGGPVILALALALAFVVAHKSRLDSFISFFYIFFHLCKHNCAQVF